MGVVVDDPGVISNVHQVILTEPIADIVVHNLYQKQNMIKNHISLNINPDKYLNTIPHKNEQCTAYRI